MSEIANRCADPQRWRRLVRAAEPRTSGLDNLRVRRRYTKGIAVFTLVLASVGTMLRWKDIDRIWLMAVALLILLAACGALGWMTSRAQSYVSRSQFIVVVVLTCLSVVLAAAAQWRGNTFLRDDWGPLALGIVLLAMSSHRPPVEIVATSVACTVFVGTLAVMQSANLTTALSPASFAVVSVVPVLALSLAGAAYFHAMAGGIQRTEATVPDRPNSRRGSRAAISSSHMRADLLERDVVPLLQGVLERGSISHQDIAGARHIAESIRLIMVAEVNRSWLTSVLRDIEATRPADSDGAASFTSTGAQDPLRLSNEMGFDQRTAIRVLLKVISIHPDYRVGSLRASIAILPGGHKRLLVNATFDPPESSDSAVAWRPAWLNLRRVARSARSAMEPCLRLTASAFPWQDVITLSSNHSIKMTVRFLYGQ